MMAVGTDCVLQSAYSSRSDTQFISTGKLLQGRCGPTLVAMKNVYEVLREKEMDLARLRTEVDALRFVAPLLSDRSSEPTDVDHAPRPDLAGTLALEKNKWPLQVGNTAPTYSDS
jgi:hypothetical protein